MREIVLDTETTGFEPSEGHRLIEIGCVEVINYIPTGRTYHQYINPEREVPPEAVAVHGITDEFLVDKPVFSQIYTEFLDFIGAARLVIHNAEFDMKFLNAELSAVGHKKIPMKQSFDTLQVAREKFPGSPANLDALCRRFNIDNSNREFHGALLDAELLAEVYLELMGGRQCGLALESEIKQESATIRSKENASVVPASFVKDRPFRPARPQVVSKVEKAAHAEMLEKIENPLWLKEKR